MLPHSPARVRRPLSRRQSSRRPEVETLEDRCLLSAPTSFTSVGIGGGGYLGAPVVSPYNGNEFYMATDMGAGYHTTDGGLHWATTNPFQGQISGTFYHPVQFTSDPNVLYGTSFNIYGLNWLPEKSSDGGVTWNTTADPTGGSLSQVFGDLHNANNLVVTGNNSIYLSTNGGGSFGTVAGPAGSGAPLTLTLPADNNQLYVAGLYSTSTNDNLYLATNAGLLVGTPSGGAYSWGFYQYGSGGSGLPGGTSVWSFAGATTGGTTKLYAVLWSDSAVGPSTYSNAGSSTYAGTYALTVGQGAWTALPSVPQESGASPDTPIYIGCTPDNPNIIYQGGSNAYTAPTVWLSTDGGQSWTQTVQYAGNANLQTGTVGQQNDYPWGYGAMVTGLSVCPTNVNDVLISTWVGGYRTTDGGAHWTSVVQANPQPEGSSAKGVPYVSSINPTGNFYASWGNANNMVAGYSDLGVDVSTDGGNSWAVPSFPGNWALTPTNVTYAAQYDANNGTWYAAGGDYHNLFVGTSGDISGGNGGVFYSTDQGKTWYFLHNFGATATSLAFDPTDATHNTMYVTLVDTDHGLGGVWVTRDLQDGTGAQWFHLNQPTVAWGPAAGQSANHHPYTVHVLNNGQLVVTYAREDSEMYQGGVFTATVNWSAGTPTANWTDVTWNDGNSTVDAMRTWPMDLTIDPTDPTQQTWYAGSYIDGRYAVDFFEAKGLWKTTNGGQTWSLVWGNTADPSVPGYRGVFGGYVNPSTGELYFSTQGNGLYYSANPNAASPTFSVVTAFPFDTPTRVEFNPYNTSQVWVGSFGDGLLYGGSATVTVPAAPTGLGASAGDGQVSLTWNASAGATSYSVYRGTNAGQETLIASGIATASFTDTGLNDGTTYFYEVTAANSAGSSGDSGEASATPQAAQNADSIVVYLSEDAWQGDAQYTISVDGRPVGGTGTAIALHGQGLTQAVILAGPYAPGAHTVAVTFINDAYGGTPQTDRNLYVDRIVYLGATYPGATLYSNGTVNFQVGPVNTLPGPWTDVDIGSPGVAGGASYSNGTFTVQGGGSDIWNNSDQLNYAYENWSGDGTIIAQVDSNANAGTYAKAGIMFRDSTAANASWVMLALDQGSGAAFEYRNGTGASAAAAGYAAGNTPPEWLKLVRSGNTFTAFVSANGSSWTQIGGSVTVNLATAGLVGLAVDANNNAALNTATFSNVAVLPAHLSDTDIGGPGQAGSAGYNPSSGSYTISGGGSDIWGAADQFNYLAETVSGPATAAAEVTAITNTDPWAKAGVMLRDSAAAGSMFVDVVATEGNGVSLQWRSSTGGQCGYTEVGGIAAPSASAPVWVKLVRSGTTYTGSYSLNGSSWTTIGSVNVTFSNSSYLAGLAVTAHNNSLLNTATFASVSISDPAFKGGSKPVVGSKTAYTFSLTYKDLAGVNTATLGNGNIQVTGPNSYSQTATLTGYTVNSDGSVTANYSVAAPTAGWTAGTYSVKLLANQVKNQKGLYFGAEVWTFAG